LINLYRHQQAGEQAAGRTTGCSRAEQAEQQAAAAEQAAEQADECLLQMYNYISLTSSFIVNEEAHFQTTD
jgi:hypothetical protein